MTEKGPVSMKKQSILVMAILAILAACCQKPDPHNLPVDGAIRCNFDHLPGEKTTCPILH